MSTVVEVAPRYEAVPFTPTAPRAAIVSKIMRETMRFETIFTDYHKACDKSCGECEKCLHALSVIAYMLSHADSRSWEVWSDEGELVGVLLLTRVVPGVDAEAHYVFFDGKLKDKTSLLESMIEWVFEDHDDWKALRRLTVAIPDYAFALAKHAQRHLGFGGDFVWSLNDKRLRVEGVRRGAFRWRGVDRDMLLLGRVR